ncbi:MAG: MerR family DNA-binding transcriptional regulator [Bacteroidales bacterium]|nr:MerR family DNA-binding transcriptional regulator [Bacteroidales bacterium]
MEKTKYKIGEFSKLARVTVRTLRHYEDIGLLKPDIVDGIWNQEDPEKWLTIIQVPVRKRASAHRPTP